MENVQAVIRLQLVNLSHNIKNSVFSYYECRQCGTTCCMPCSNRSTSPTSRAGTDRHHTISQSLLRKLCGQCKKLVYITGSCREPMYQMHLSGHTTTLLWPMFYIHTSDVGSYMSWQIISGHYL